MSTKPNPHEPLYSLVRGSVGMVPVVGSLLTEMLGNIVTDPAVRRRDEFAQSLLERIVALEEAGELRREDITGENDASPIILQAMQIAARSRGEEKLNAIRSATLSGLRNPPNKRTLAEIVLNVIDRMTPEHFQILRIVCRDFPSATFDTRNLINRSSNAKKGSHGMVEPVTAPGTAPSQGLFVEKADHRLEVSINTVLVGDLVALGLIHREVVKPDRKGDDPFGSDRVEATDLGRLVYKHIFRLPSDGLNY